MGNLKACPDERVEEYATGWSSALSTYAKLFLSLWSKHKQAIVLRDCKVLQPRQFNISDTLSWYYGN